MKTSINSSVVHEGNYGPIKQVLVSFPGELLHEEHSLPSPPLQTCLISSTGREGCMIEACVQLGKLFVRLTHFFKSHVHMFILISE